MAAAVPQQRPAIHDAAFERMYRRYVKDVYRYTLALLQNPADAEDVTQTTFLNAWRAYRGGVDPVKPHNWLIKIAHNAARTRYAVAARRPQEVPLEEGVDDLPVAAEDAPDVRGVLQALSELPFNQRAALVMRELEGRSYAEIAEALEVSVAAVETLIFRARRSLRLHRSKLRALGAVQLPPSLASFFENGGGAVVGGGALLGSGLLTKAAVVLATGIAAGGVGYTAVEAADRARPVVPEPVFATRHPSVPAKPVVRAKAAVASLAKAQTKRAAATPRTHAARRRALGAHFVQSGSSTPAPAPTARPAPAGTPAPAARADEPQARPAPTQTVARTTPIVTSKVPPVHVPAVTPPAPPSVPTVQPPPLPPVDLPPPPKLP